jgi:hypothetical protein
MDSKSQFAEPPIRTHVVVRSLADAQENSDDWHLAASNFLMALAIAPSERLLPVIGLPGEPGIDSVVRAKLATNQPFNLADVYDFFASSGDVPPAVANTLVFRARAYVQIASTPRAGMWSDVLTSIRREEIADLGLPAELASELADAAQLLREAPEVAEDLFDKDNLAALRTSLVDHLSMPLSRSNATSLLSSVVAAYRFEAAWRVFSQAINGSPDVMGWAAAKADSIGIEPSDLIDLPVGR